MSDASRRPLTFRHLYVLDTLAQDREAFHLRAVLRCTGGRTLTDLIGLGFIEAAGGKRGEPARYRATASGLAWMAETLAARQERRSRPSPATADTIALAAHITRNVARVAAERGLTVAEVETRAGMRRGFLSPMDGSKLSVAGIAAVADVLGVKAGDIVDERSPA